MEQKYKHTEKSKNPMPFSDIPTLCKIGRLEYGVVIVGKDNKFHMWNDRVVGSMMDALKSTKSPVKILVYGFSRAKMGHLINGIYVNTARNCGVVTWKDHYIIIVNEKETNQ